VQFGEPINPKVLSASFAASKRAELFSVIRTSGVASSASEMPLIAFENGAKVVEINPDPTILTPYMSLSIRGEAVEFLPQIWKKLLTV